MSTTPKPPEGFQLLTDEEKTRPLPREVLFYSQLSHLWVHCGWGKKLLPEDLRDGFHATRISATDSAPGDGWRPITEAPKDGTYVLLSSKEVGGSWIGRYKAKYASGYIPENPWQCMMLNCHHLPARHAPLIPTHFQPLPLPPPQHP